MTRLWNVDDMRNLLDDEVLNGLHVARISYRPERTCLPIIVGHEGAVLDAIRQECQFWGGATTPLVPVAQDGAVAPEYARILAGSAVDRIEGLDLFGLFHMPEARVKLPVEQTHWGRQLGVTLLEYRRQDTYRRLEVVELDNGDPWRGIYAACLGLLPDRPDPSIIRSGNFVPSLTFDDFVNVDGVTTSGSLDDLLERLTDETSISPRSLSMIHLAYGSDGSSSIRAEGRALPEPGFARFDAGPNVVVVCSEGCAEDYCLLWNLRGAYGDRRPLPIGIPASETTVSVVQSLARNPRISRNGIAAKAVYVTSASLNVGDLLGLLDNPEGKEIGVAGYSDMLTLGPAAQWTRDDVLIWQNGRTSFLPVDRDRHRDVLSEQAFSSTARMYVDLEVLEYPFPAGDDIRVDAGNFTFYAGSQSRWGSARTASEAIDANWPSRLLMARSVASCRDLELEESEPGRAGLVLLSGLRDVQEIDRLAHKPLLDLLEQMASKSGTTRQRHRLRDSGQDLESSDVVSPTPDLLPERPFDAFLRALGNNHRAATFWLHWAEKCGLIVKGFQLRCPICRAKQWIPVAAFSPPIICRGCAEVMDTPFGNQPHIDFKYRVSERVRRVYEHDAMGHLLVMRYFHSLFYSKRGGQTIGMHPGIAVRRTGSKATLGEADVLLLMRSGNFVPIEVKRSSTGFAETAVERLNSLADALAAPWSAAAACEYGRDAAAEFVALEQRESDSPRFRIVLSYDSLLDPHPVWALGADPFLWRPMTEGEVQERETDFVKRLSDEAEHGTVDWLAQSMLNKPTLRSDRQATASEANEAPSQHRD